MTSNNVNLPSGGNGTATPSKGSIDNEDFLDFEEQDRPVNPEPEQAALNDDSETTEAESQEVENPEAEQAEADDNETDEDQAQKPLTDDVTVKLPTGETVALAELKDGYLRDRDYRIKTTQVAEKRRDLEAQAARVSQTVDVLADFLAKQLPPEPDPLLIYNDPQTHYRQKAIYDAAIAQISAVIELGSAPKQALGKLTNEQRAEVLATENAKLAERFPMTTKEQGRKEFFDRAVRAAAQLGIPASEVQSETDHRRFALAYYASIGLEAEAARQTAKTKVQGVPAVSPPRRQATQGAAAIKGRQEAVQRLKSTGRLDDALGLID